MQYCFHTSSELEGRLQYSPINRWRDFEWNRAFLLVGRSCCLGDYMRYAYRKNLMSATAGPVVMRNAMVVPSDHCARVQVYKVMATRKHPSVDCGKISSKTIRLRPEIRLTEYERKQAKRLRENGNHFDEIASRLKRDVSDVEKSLSTIRTKRADPSRYTANISEAAYQKLKSIKLPNEPVWQTVNRILGV